MKILLTGADGFLGSNLTRELLKRGYQVRAFIQPGRDVRLLDGLQVEKHEGDLLIEDDLIEAINGCDVVIHTAANTNLWPSRSVPVWKVNVEGTQNVIEAALKEKVGRMIYVGTANSFGFGSKEHPGTEKNPYSAGKYKLNYTDSKYKAHQLVLEAVKERNLPAVIMNPTFMFGPYDSKPGAGQMIVALYNQKVPGYTRGGRNYVCVKDAAVAIANGIEKGEIGESYILGNRNMSYKEAFQLIASIIGKKAPTMPIPCFASKIFGMLGSMFASLTGSIPRVSLPMARMSCDDHYFSAEKARKVLGLPQTPIEEGIRESFEWLKSNGYI